MSSVGFRSEFHHAIAVMFGIGKDEVRVLRQPIGNASAVLGLQADAGTAEFDADNGAHGNGVVGLPTCPTRF